MGVLKRTWVIAALCSAPMIWAETTEQSLFAKNSIEISGTASVGKDSSFFVMGTSRESYNTSFQTAKRWYMDISPVFSYYIIDKGFIYASPAFSLQSTRYELGQQYIGGSQLNVAAHDYGNNYFSTGYVPYIGMGYIFIWNEKIFLSAAADMQWRRYTSVYLSYSLSRFNLRLTPKILLGERIFFNIGVNLYYETDRVLLPGLKKSSLSEPVDMWGVDLQGGFSWIF